MYLLLNMHFFTLLRNFTFRFRNFLLFCATLVLIYFLVYYSRGSMVMLLSFQTKVVGSIPMYFSKVLLFFVILFFLVYSIFYSLCYSIFYSLCYSMFYSYPFLSTFTHRNKLEYQHRH